MKPIIFDTESVRAIHAGRKSQTRQAMKPQPVIDADGMWHWKDCQWMDGGIGFPASGIADHAPHKAGDVLWVRETWMPCDSIYSWISSFDDYAYKADCSDSALHYVKAKGLKWRSPIHMPREATRIFLRVKGIRAERLWGIDDEEAILEGFEGCSCICEGEDRGASGVMAADGLQGRSRNL